MSKGNLSIGNKTKGKLPRLPFVKIKNAILGEDYNLDLSFLTPAESRKINRAYRHKNYTPNVLSFSLSKKEGEIVITPAAAKKEARLFGMKTDKFIGYLLIHGLLHLKGFRHSSKMSSNESRLCTKFKLR